MTDLTVEQTFQADALYHAYVALWEVQEDVASGGPLQRGLCYTVNQALFSAINYGAHCSSDPCPVLKAAHARIMDAIEESRLQRTAQEERKARLQSGAQEELAFADVQATVDSLPTPITEESLRKSRLRREAQEARSGGFPAAG